MAVGNAAPLRRSNRNVKPLLNASNNKDNPSQPQPSMTTAKTTSSPAKRKRKTVVVSPSPKKFRKKASTLDSPTRIGDKLSSLSTTLAMVAPEEPFVDLRVSPVELRPSNTLTTGQCFHWRDTGRPSEHGPIISTSTSAWGSSNATEWVGVLPVSSSSTTTRHCVVLIRETPTTTLYRVLHAPPNVSSADVSVALKDYFQLHVSLQDLYHDWSRACPRLEQIATCLPGVRVVKQDPWECLVSFLCSSNNNIPRITKMLNAIRATYGTPLLRVQPNDSQDEIVFYSFPTLKHLKQHAAEDDLRLKCGMGYRAKYLMQTMETLTNLGGELYLHKLLQNNKDPTVVQEALCQFHGVGRKVADCVALFSLNQTEAIPVDVHVWNVALRDYDVNQTLRQAKSLTPTIYNQVGTLFRSRFCDFAGWAHSLLFVAELPSFKPVLPQELIEEMDKFREAEQAKKKAAKTKKQST